MKQHTTKPSANLLSNILQCKCPKCREGKLFTQPNPYKLKEVLSMHHECPVCKQPTEIEVGFYTGAAYVAYALTVALAVSIFVAWYVLIGFTFSLDDNRIFGCLATTIVGIVVMTPVFMRLSRIIWLSFFVHFDPNWRTNGIGDYERINPIGMESARQF
ncbi:MAG: DUF983 domain-containing protein [Pseudopedobacter saltans]|uniref:DUF983 domain-containing protein n=1 Tax=Pseudopedobacter saltans TaxID=151895 RepID=A0A2W5EFA6_9SPHI|nr:MAG: DUF983 domain-containing protein [Pseudopedobacter saltans]